MEQNEIVNKSTKIKIIVITILIFLVSVAGVTYAYFTINITGNDTASSMLITTADMTLRYTDIQIISGDDAEPGWTQTKTLTVENIGNVPTTYNIIWRDLYNEITNNELVISATCSSSSGSCPAISETVIPMRLTEAHNVLVKNKISIPVGVTHTYTVTVTFKETHSVQNYNQDKEFYGTLNIGEPTRIISSGTDSTTGLPLVKIKNEEFYDITNAVNYTSLISSTGNVYNYASGKSVLLAKYNLLVGDVLTKEDSIYTFIKTLSSSDSGYGLQSQSAIVGETGRTGVVPFSGTNYWDNNTCQYTGTTWGCQANGNGLKAEYAIGGASYSGSPQPNVYNSALVTVPPEIVVSGTYRNAQNNGYTIAYYVETYISTLGVNAIGRLLTREEEQVLESSYNSAVVTGSSYWLGTAENATYVWWMRYDGTLKNTFNFARAYLAGARPVLIVNTSEIELLR